MEEAQPMWVITAVRDTTSYQPGSGWVAAKQVVYRLYDGTVHSIEIPRSEYNAETVQDKIHTEALKHQQVMNLSGPDVRYDIPRTTPHVPDVIR